VAWVLWFVGVGVVVDVLVGTAVFVGVRVSVLAAVFVVGGVAVLVDVLVGTAVFVGVRVSVLAAVFVVGGVAVLVDVLVGTAVFVGVPVRVLARVSVRVTVAELVAILVGVLVGVGVVVAMAVTLPCGVVVLASEVAVAEADGLGVGVALVLSTTPRSVSLAITPFSLAARRPSMTEGKTCSVTFAITRGPIQFAGAPVPEETQWNTAAPPLGAETSHVVTLSPPLLISPWSSNVGGRKISGS
jgi:hypothetical protein